MANGADAAEPMQRVTLTVTFDLGLLMIEGKSEKSGRLFNGDFRTDKAAELLKTLAKRLAANVQTLESLELQVDPNTFRILPDQ